MIIFEIIGIAATAFIGCIAITELTSWLERKKNRRCKKCGCFYNSGDHYCSHCGYFLLEEEMNNDDR